MCGCVLCLFVEVVFCFCVPVCVCTRTCVALITLLKTVHHIAPHSAIDDQEPSPSPQPTAHPTPNLTETKQTDDATTDTDEGDDLLLESPQPTTAPTPYVNVRNTRTYTHMHARYSRVRARLKGSAVICGVVHCMHLATQGKLSWVHMHVCVRVATYVCMCACARRQRIICAHACVCDPVFVCFENVCTYAYACSCV